MVGLTFIQKKLVSYTEISIFSLIEFPKIVDFYRIIEFPKANQTDIPDYQYFVGSNAKRMVCLTDQTDQIDIPDYQYFVGSNAKRMVCLTALQKK